MSFVEIVRFEVTYLLRRPTTWIFLVALVLVAYLTATGMLVQEAQRGDLYVNAPIGIASATVIVSLLGLLVTAALAGDAGARDVDTGMHPLVYTSPMEKASYVGGRFIGLFVVNAALLTVVPLAIWAGVAMGDVDPSLVGPLRPAAYVQAYVFLAFPNAFVQTALLFTAALLTRRALASYVTGAGLFMLMIAGEEVIAETLGMAAVGALLDPVGFAPISELWSQWTTFEKNTNLVWLSEMLLPNRLLWLAISLVALAIAYRTFRFQHFAGHEWRWWRAARLSDDEVPASPVAQVARPPVEAPRAFDVAARLRQMFEVARRALPDMVWTKGFLGVAAVVIVLVYAGAGASLHDYLGTPMWPAPGLVVGVLSSRIIVFALSVIVAVYTGELVWKERDARLSQIADAAPIPDWARFAGKGLALVGFVVVLQLVVLAGAVALQLTAGVYDIALGLYLRVLFGLHLIDYVLLIALALFVHNVLNHKQLGHMIVLLFFAFTQFAGLLGVSHNLLVYGGAPGWVYSDIAGFGPFLGPVLWFKLYWAGWAALLALAANLLHVRGRETSLHRRVRLARQRFRRPAAAIASLSALMILTTGGFIFYNTNVLNENLSREQQLALGAEYERRWGAWSDAPQPTVSGTTLHVEIYPENRIADVRGTYRLENRTNVTIDTVLLWVNPEVVLEDVDFSRPADTARAEPTFGQAAYALAEPLAPDDTLRLDFRVRFEPRGFPNRGINTSVVRNGTYFDHTGGRRPNHRRWLPVIGLQQGFMLSDARDRATHELDPAPPIPARTDSTALWNAHGRETIDFEAVIGTSASQTALAPGTLRREWTEGGRRYFHYASEQPIRNSFAIFSAEYAVREAEWNGVQIELYHHPAHDYNIERMTRSVKAALAYHVENFGPYPFSQIRVAEFPRYASSASAYPGTISYAEAFGFLTRVNERRHIDTPFMVLAHEVAHQWWGQQIVPANVEGAPVLTEVLAQYGAMMVTEHAYGPEMVRRFLQRMRIEYLNRRHRTENREQPLFTTAENRNVVYRKGSITMYALREYLDEKRLNSALRTFLDTHAEEGPPYPTTLDLYDEIRAVTPDSLKSLVADFFERTVIWDFRVDDARAEQLPSGEWRVTLDFSARKLATDSLGAETEVDMNHPVEIGIYAGDARGIALGEPLYQTFHRVDGETQSLTVTVPRRPERAGVDPRNLLLSRQLDGNVRQIRVREGGAAGYHEQPGVQ